MLWALLSATPPCSMSVLCRAISHQSIAGLLGLSLGGPATDRGPIMCSKALAPPGDGPYQEQPQVAHDQFQLRIPPPSQLVNTGLHAHSLPSVPCPVHCSPQLVKPLPSPGADVPVPSMRPMMQSYSYCQSRVPAFRFSATLSSIPTHWSSGLFLVVTIDTSPGMLVFPKRPSSGLALRAWSRIGEVRASSALVVFEEGQANAAIARPCYCATRALLWGRQWARADLGS